MPSAIFAICCHLFFYSRSAAALRVAEVDDYLSQVPCTGKAQLLHGKNYICKKLCAPSGASKGKQMTLQKCLELIETTKDAVVVQTTKLDGSGDCAAYTKTFLPAKTCSGGEIFTIALQGSIFGDPHVVNMAGEKFDILTTGTFSLVSLTRATEEDLAINGTVVRFGTKCGQSFIDDLELTGGWIREIYNTKALKVRAIQDAPQTEALQVNFGQKWQPLRDLQEMTHVKKTADQIQLDLSKVTVQVGAGKHKHHGWNFLNLDVQGLATLDNSIHVGGLLGYDDHTKVLQADADCAMFAEATETDTQDQQSCLSYLNAN